MAEGRDRPHIRTSIVQLETMFREGPADVHTLRALDHELSFERRNVLRSFERKLSMHWVQRWLGRKLTPLLLSIALQTPSKSPP